MGSQYAAPLGDLRNIQTNDSAENALKQDATNEIHRSLNNASSVSVVRDQHQSLEEKAPLLDKLLKSQGLSRLNLASYPAK
ncbi:hypothetical protein BDDG_12394 [Blastomyces dermatitidis ATCC 18188]|uniref:Uncharacterized protein n=1 Tax=Ajellomyces dermatitidis (strain ATCC 18188 / CBS 674.68) TaxID=653446 RepID=A0A0J9EPB2_AJEDA|nr:hypothetical protein BDDG_12394 [Blastomyces dermatitidis ATCC 18188]